MAETLEGLDFDALGERLAADGVNRVHALPLFQSLHGREGVSFPPPLERWLAGRAPEERVVAEETALTESGDGWTRKFLLRLRDGAEVESVLMGYPGRFTACLSTQVGCAMGCVFCATGQMGFRRHLEAGEIVAQAHHVTRAAERLFDERVRNLVMMGMGEPLHNYEATMQALDILTDTRGLNLGPARVSISTVGHVPGILRLARHPKRYTLAVSLHGASDEERSKLIPVNRRWPLAELLDAIREFAAIRRQRVLVAWTLIGGVNDDLDTAARLASLLGGLPVQVNLIPLNPTDGYDGEVASAGRVHAFQRTLQQGGIPATVRQRRGIDVDAGCGQLRARSGAQ